MKKILIFSLLMAIFVTVLFAKYQNSAAGYGNTALLANIDLQNPPENLLKNGSFEEGINQLGIPKYWGDNVYSQKLETIDQKQVLKISNPKSGYYIGAQIIPIDCQAGEFLTIMGNIRGEKIVPQQEKWQGAKVQIIFLDKNGEELGAIQETNVYTESFDWDFFIKKIIVPANAVKAKILLGLWGASGTVYFDELQLYKTPVAKGLKENLLVNGDFELWGNWEFLGEGDIQIKAQGAHGSAQALYVKNDNAAWSFAAQKIMLSRNAAEKFIITGDISYKNIIVGQEHWQRGRIYAEFLDDQGK
jgi:hypothetical protein